MPSGYFYDMKRLLPLICICLLPAVGQAQDSLIMRNIFNEVMLHGTCYNNLRVLCKQIGNRLSGTPQAAKAVEWGAKMLTEAGADVVYLQPVDVPVWVRGKESLKLPTGKKNELEDVKMLSLGNTVGTDDKLLDAEIVMVTNYDEFKALTIEQVKGKIVFFNHLFKQDLVNPFEGYGEAGQYRWNGPNWASAKGAVAVIIRSVSTGVDDFPHTGSLKYADTVKPIPAVAIGNFTADKLEAICKVKTVHAQLQSQCHMADTVHSYNVIAEIKGTDHADEIITVGGHLDSWDVGEGAHDDGTGVVQTIEVVRTFKAMHIRPRRTIRAVLFMNEENGLCGGSAYCDSAKARKEHHILALETDAGGFSPRGIGLEMPEGKRLKMQHYAPLFLPYGVYDFYHDEGGADISPLHKKLDVPVAGLLPDAQRYFDIHHTNNDVFENVNHRELKMGAFTLAAMVYLISEYGL